MPSPKYAATRFGQSVITLFVVISFNFWLFRVLPGNFTQLVARAGSANPAGLAEMKRTAGLDQPLPQQYVIYLKDLVTFHWGVSFVSHEPVFQVVAEALVNTLILISVAYVATLLLGVAIGVASCARAGSRADALAVGGSLILWSMPTFWLGLMLILVFSVWWGGLPVSGMETYGNHALAAVDVVRHLVLPTATLVVGGFAHYVVTMRTSLLRELGEDYITTARAKGLSVRRIRWRHAVPNALLPTFTLAWLNLGAFISGTLTVEVVFSWPGLGTLIYQSVDNLDYPVLEVAFLVIATVVILANLVNDLLYPLLDPRVARA